MKWQDSDRYRRNCVAFMGTFMIPALLTLWLIRNASEATHDVYELIPRDDEPMEFAITPEKKIVFADGREFDKIDLVKEVSKDGKKLPRGIMLMIEDPKYWETAN